jgi:hypothetical protein
MKKLEMYYECWLEPKDIVRYREVAASPAMKGRLIGRMRRSSLLEDKMGL